MQIVTIGLTILAIALVETVSVLVYKVVKIQKDLEDTMSNVDRLAECVLTMAKQNSDADVVQVYERKTTDFNFPNKEGF